MAEAIRVGPIAMLQEGGPQIVKGNKQVIVVFYHQGRVYAVNNRCPHMGFPLHMGSLCDGILTCHWHHARFDLESGGTLDPWADDVTTYRTWIEEGDVWVDPTPQRIDTIEHHRKRLREGLEQNIRLVIAKAVVGLIEAGEPAESIARIGVEYGTTHRAGGWRSGLTILTAMVNVLPKLDKEGQILALFQGLVHVAQESAGEGTRFMLEPLPDQTASIDRLAGWYRRFIEVRDTVGAERVLLTAIQARASEQQLADMMMTAVTDHFYMDGGHVLDFHNKAFEVLRYLDEAQRARVLTSLLPQLRHASRSEELNTWQAPVDLVQPMEQAFRELPDVLSKPYAEPKLIDEEGLITQMLSDQPHQTVNEMMTALKQGMSPVRLAQLVTLAAAERVARFNVQNEFSDWFTVLHTFTHAHAVHQSLLRSPTAALVRAVFHAAMTIYLDRFLNIPPAPWPDVGDKRDGEPSDPGELLTILNRQQQVAEAGQWVMTYLKSGGDRAALFNTLGHALLREDAEFHSFQMYEAAVIEHDHWTEELSPLAARAQQTMILAATRYLAAHAPTPREIPHVARIAQRLHRGEKLYESM